MRVWIYLVVAIGLGMSGCSSLTPAEKREFQLRQMVQEIEDEKAIGRQMAAKLLGHLGEYRKDAQAHRYLEMVGQSLVDRVGRPELKYHFGILSSKEANAFATPGGYIFVTQGLLALVRSEDELAAVLAHEIAHVNEKHMYREIVPKREVNASEVVVRLMSRGGSDLGGSISQIVNKGLNILLEKGIAEDLEVKADEGALFYLAQLGYAPSSLLSLRTRLYDRKTAKSEQEVPKARLTHIKKKLAENAFDAPLANKKQKVQKRFQRSLASVGRR